MLTPNAPVAAVVFDLDGTLADTAPDIRQALNLALADEALGPLDLDTVKTMIGAGPRVLVQRALARHRADTGDETVTRVTAGFDRHYEAGGNALSRLFPDAGLCIDALVDMGIPLGVCSNKPEPFCKQLLRDLGVLDCFGVVRGYGSGLPPKPDPALLLSAFDTLSASPQDSLYVGDSETDVRTARAAGVRCAVVGHGYTQVPAAALGGDEVLGSLADVPALCRG